MYACVYVHTQVCAIVCIITFKYILFYDSMQCPYCHRDKLISGAAEDPTFCLQVLPDGRQQLRCNHSYYYQVCYTDVKEPSTIIMSTLFHCVNIGTMSVVLHRKNVL